MSSRLRRLTTVGLPVREELQVRSLLQVIHANTLDEWAFHDGLDADIALCSPRSALSATVIKHASQTASMACVAVLHEGESSLPGTPSLMAPIKSADFIALLNRISSSGIAGIAAAATPGNRAEPSHLSGGVMDLAMALRDLLNQGAQAVHRLDCHGTTLFILPSARALLLPAPLQDRQIGALLAGAEFSLQRLEEHEAQSLVPEGAAVHGIDPLLWRIGLEGLRGSQLRDLPVGARFHLRRWPDFARLKHEPFHFRMTAMLTRAAYGIEELARASERSAEDVRAFINACAMCNWVEAHPVAATVATRTVPVATPGSIAQGIYAGLFRSIRNVLGMRA